LNVYGELSERLQLQLDVTEFYKVQVAAGSNTTSGQYGTSYCPDGVLPSVPVCRVLLENSSPKTLHNATSNLKEL
jgi:hypothetical protein